MKYSLRLEKRPWLFDVVVLVNPLHRPFTVAYRIGGKILHREENAYHVLWEDIMSLDKTMLEEEYEKNKDYYFEEAKKLFIKDML